MSDPNISLRNGEAATGPSKWRDAILGLGGLVCGIVLGSLITWPRHDVGNPGSQPLEAVIDDNGVTNVVYLYERDILVRAQHDRNADGAFDYFETFEDGIISSSEADDDFDGKIDGWLTYRIGNLWRAKHDSNRDGDPDEVYHYEHGISVRGEYDWNFDGVFDYSETFEGGIRSSAEADDDFDGKIDGWSNYEHGRPSFSKHDTDKNGVPDVFQHYGHGVIRMVVWRSNDASKPTRIEFYDKAVKARELRDSDGDGLLETQVKFDAFENRISEERLNNPLTAEQAMSTATSGP